MMSAQEWNVAALLKAGWVCKNENRATGKGKQKRRNISKRVL
jgi:hypothetical protein